MHAAAVPSTSQGSQEIRKYRRSMLASVGFKHKHIQHFNNRIQLFLIAKCRDSPPRQHRRAFTELRNLIQIDARGSLSRNVGVVQLHAQHNPNPVACLILYAVLERIVKDLKLPG